MMILSSFQDVRHVSTSTRRLHHAVRCRSTAFFFIDGALQSGAQYRILVPYSSPMGSRITISRR